MRHGVRLALVVVGLGAIVYGAASLTGGWLGTQPWWERLETTDEWLLREGQPIYLHAGEAPVYVHHGGGLVPDPPYRLVPRAGREWITGGIVAVGLGLAAVGAWPRRPCQVGQP